MYYPPVNQRRFVVFAHENPPFVDHFPLGFSGNFRILKWRSCTMVGILPYIDLIHATYLQYVPEMAVELSQILPYMGCNEFPNHGFIAFSSPHYYCYYYYYYHYYYWLVFLPQMMIDTNCIDLSNMFVQTFIKTLLLISQGRAKSQNTKEIQGFSGIAFYNVESPKLCLLAYKSYNVVPPSYRLVYKPQ